MNELLELVLDVGTKQGPIFFAIFLRIGAAMALLPAVGEQSVPQRIRLGLAIVFSIIVLPFVAVEIEPTLPEGIAWVGFLASETAVGLTLGVSLRLFVLALQTAGSMIAQSTSLSQIFGGASPDPQPAIGHLLLISGLALTVTLGLHVRIAELFIVSYSIFPVGSGISGAELAKWGIDHIAAMFRLAFSIAAPFLITSLIYNLALGAINRAMPQLMVSFVGAPAITAGGLVLLFVASPIILTVWADAVFSFLDQPFVGSSR